MQAAQPASQARPFVGQEEVKLHHNKATIEGKPGETVGIKIPADGGTYRVRLEQVKAPTAKAAEGVLNQNSTTFTITYTVKITAPGGYESEKTETLQTSKTGKALKKEIAKKFEEAKTNLRKWGQTEVKSLMHSKNISQETKEHHHHGHHHKGHHGKHK